MLNFFESSPLLWGYAAGALVATWLFYLLIQSLLRRQLARAERIGRISGLLGTRLPGRIAAVLALGALLILTALVPQLHLLAADWSQRILQVLLLIACGLFVGAAVSSLGRLYEHFRFGEKRQIKGYLQMCKILLYIWIGLLAFAILTGQSVLYYISGLGAVLAIILLLFRETILSFVATLQIQAGDIVRIGDWIEAPEYGVDGEVKDIALHSVSVENWDKTTATMPTSSIVNTPLKNWRGMTLAEARRIKRAIQIDMTSIRFLSAKEVQSFGRFELLDDYMAAKQKELQKHNSRQGKGSYRRRMTNIGTFRAYALAYLKTHPKLRTEDMTCLVRQLSPGPQGLPLELYFFTATTDWLDYESIQADVFDHLLAIMPEFDLRPYQRDLLGGLARQGVPLYSRVKIPEDN